MTIKEITALRKSGNLQEALAAAETEFATNQNNYTASALFWCLNDLVKQQTGEEFKATIERMNSLYSIYCAGDEIMQQVIAQREQPHFQELKDAIGRAKAGGDIRADYRTFESLFNAGKLDNSLYPNFGWLIYYALKQTSPSDAHVRKVMLSKYLKLDLPKPSILHSLILTEAIKVEKNTPLQFRIRDFIRLWGIENLRNDDWEQFRTERGITFQSTVENMISVYAKELETDGVESPEEFSQLVDKALIKYPKSQYLPYYKATILISQGKADEALTYYKKMILQSPSRAFLWNKAEKLIEDLDTKIGFLCKALTCGTDDEYLGSVRLRLVSLLCQKGLKANASYELEKYNETYKRKGWHLSNEFLQLRNQLSSVESADSNAAVYAEFATKADEFIYSSLPTIPAIKVAESKDEDRNHPGRKITTWILRTENSTARLRKPSKFGLNKHTPNGVAFDIKMQDNKIVWIKEHLGAISVPWLHELRGEVKLRIDKNGKKYAIISGSFVGENLLKGINDGQMVKILSIQQKDGRWSAISILKP